MGTMRIQDQTGYTEITWDKANPASVAVAEKVFNGLMAKNHVAYKTDAKGEGEVIKSFDLTADEIVVAVPLIGGRNQYSKHDVTD